MTSEEYNKYYKKVGLDRTEAEIANDLDNLYHDFTAYTSRKVKVVKILQKLKELKKMLGFPNEAFFHGLRQGG